MSLCHASSQTTAQTTDNTKPIPNTKLDELAYAERIEELEIKKIKRIQMQMDLLNTLKTHTKIDRDTRDIFENDLLSTGKRKLEDGFPIRHIIDYENKKLLKVIEEKDLYDPETDSDGDSNLGLDREPIYDSDGDKLN